jgi:hypothetical protein
MVDLVDWSRVEDEGWPFPVAAPPIGRTSRLEQLVPAFHLRVVSAILLAHGGKHLQSGAQRHFQQLSLRVNEQIDERQARG